MAGPNAFSPERMSADERLTELASILALGLVRLKARQSSRLSAPGPDRSLHSVAEESVCDDPCQGESSC
jgi:hypothetical protein